MFRLGEKIRWGGTGTLQEVLAGAKATVILEEKLIEAVERLANGRLFYACCKDDAAVPPRVAEELRAAASVIIADKLYPVAVICRAGQERSMAAAAYLHSRFEGMSFDDAVVEAKKLRPDGMRHSVFQSTFRELMA